MAKTSAPALSAERAALAEAIDTLREHQARHDAMTTAYQDAAATVHALYMREEVAEAALQQAEANRSEVLVRVAMGKLDGLPLSPREARENLATVRAELASARETRDALQAELETIATRRFFPETRVRECAHEVIRTEAAEHARALVAEVEALQVRYQRTISTLDWLVRQATVFATNQQHGVSYGRVLDPHIAETVGGMFNAPDRWPGASRQATTWPAALEALMTDAGARLPIPSGD